MKTLIIALKEIKQALRDKRTFVFMLAFPIVLILILGMALSNAFSGNVELGEMKVLYKDTGASPALGGYWDGFVKTVGQGNVHFTPLGEGMNGQEEVKSDNYVAYVELGNEGIRFYGSTKSTIEDNIVQGMLTAFAQRYNLAASAMKTDPAAAQAVLANASAPHDIVKETALQADKSPGSIDYYAIAMTTMIALYAAMSASSLIRGERSRNTAIRLSAAPVSKSEIFAGKIIGCLFSNLICVLAVVLFSKYVFKADWGDHFGMVFLVLLSEVLLAVSLGLGLSYFFKGETARSIVMIFTQLASFLGGAYFPIGDADNFMGAVTNLSPLRWANVAINKIIYSNELGAALPAIGLNLAIAVAFLAIAIISMRRREAL
ncbi:ABC transporter permease [Cohnella nanjingensis]|uniref:ABC transporter permease n=1 Tax=Cohnella nanjingensis TaxID=1387779 RepID=A0A7X0RZ65_9BACL|nr:ABC transporter permease [Cohnella nanjingensis]MBB6675015.1 ABC transporter permease [Cohnella nanjingensis]